MFQLAVVGAFPALYSWQVEPYWLEFVELKMPIKNLPEHLVGKKLMQISDLHVSKRFDWQFLIDSFEKAKKYNPDFVVYTGDFVQHGYVEENEALKKVMKHAVLGNLGTVGILGNHDYGRNWEDLDSAGNICNILKGYGIPILNNEQIEISGLNIIGFEDLWSPNFNPMKVMEFYDRTKANLILCHNPDACDLDVWNGYDGWILSGHTHGGQCKVPVVDYAPIVPIKNKKYIKGKIDLEDGRTLYVNRALGNSYPVRFGVRPEITVFTLQKI